MEKFAVTASRTFAQQTASGMDARESPYGSLRGGSGTGTSSVQGVGLVSALPIAEVENAFDPAQMEGHRIEVERSS